MNTLVKNDRRIGTTTSMSEILWQGLLGKRSQNKKRFTPVNYKLRWFVLTPEALTYYDGTTESKRREKGRIAVSSIRWVETADLGGEPPPDACPPPSPPASPSSPSPTPPTQPFPAFQVGYTTAQGHNITLYAVASTILHRDSWLDAIRRACGGEACVTGRYHVGPWISRRWSCCGANTRSTEGCQTLSWAPKPEMSGDTNQPTGGSASTPAAALVSTASTPGPGTPANRPKDRPTSTSSTLPTKTVVALYSFKAIDSGDLSLEKGDEYQVLDDIQEHWWKVKDKHGNVGYIPSNYVKQKELLGLQKYDWYVGDMSRQRAESILRQEDKEGCFVVRNSSTKGLYTLSLYTKVPHPQVKHYHIKQNSATQYFLSEKHCRASVPELITYHRYNAGGLASRLKNPPATERSVPATAGLSHDKWEIDPSELMLLEELGSGQFGVVRRGKWRGSFDVAVKMMKEGSMSEDDFIEEAKVMTKLQHQNLVQLYGVCSKHRPIYIVTEYMKHGSLLSYLRRHETALTSDLGMLLDICIQVCKGMTYLERHNYIHRDLAARNCLVGAENAVKVADFGLARYVLDDQYTSSGGTKFPIKWAPPEVLNYTRFSSKSDIWAYGVLMWEVFTCGKMPYGRLKNTEVVERVQRGIVLECPKSCPKEVYDVMRKCWSHRPDDRPPFRLLKEELMEVARRLLLD